MSFSVRHQSEFLGLSPWVTWRYSSGLRSPYQSTTGEGLKNQTFAFSQFWRPEVQDQGATDSIPHESFFPACWRLLLFNHSVMSNSSWPHRLQHTRLPRPSLSLPVCSNSCPFSRWCCLTISFFVSLFSFCLQSFPVSVFSNESDFCIRWPKYWSFSISPSNEYWGLISFRIDWFDLLAVQGTLKSLLQHHSSNASVLWHSAFFSQKSGKSYGSFIVALPLANLPCH